MAAALAEHVECGHARQQDDRLPGACLPKVVDVEVARRRTFLPDRVGRPEPNAGLGSGQVDDDRNCVCGNARCADINTLRGERCDADSAIAGVEHSERAIRTGDQTAVRHGATDRHVRPGDVDGHVHRSLHVDVDRSAGAELDGDHVGQHLARPVEVDVGCGGNVGPGWVHGDEAGRRGVDTGDVEDCCGGGGGHAAAAGHLDPDDGG